MTERLQSSTTTRAARRLEIALFSLLAMFLVAGHLRVLLHTGALWRDEILTLNLATMPGRQLWNSLWLDSFPALFFLLLRA